MFDLLKSTTDFKTAIGEFIIAFSELEFGLVFLCMITENDLRNKNNYFDKYLGFSLDQKIKHLDIYIKENLQEIKNIWDKQKHGIKEINRERRFLVHGFMSFGFPKEKISTFLKENGVIKNRFHTIEEIKSYTNRIQHLKTGENGINGEFHILFTKLRINKWNETASKSDKITYTVNSEIVSDWKGE